MQIVELDNIEDIEMLKPLLTAWEVEADTSSFSMPPPAWHITINTLLDLVQGRTSTLLALETESRLVGLIGGRVSANHFSDAVICNECFWYVMPVYRSHSKRLINGLKQWAATQGCTHIIINTSKAASGKSEKVGLLLQRWGLIPYESSFIGVL